MLHKVMYPDAPEDTFKASHGWLHRFKQRHGMRELRLQGESLSADTASIEPCRKKLHQYIEDEQLGLHQIFNADETGLYWRLLPEKTLAGSYEKSAKNFKKPKDRVTLLATANASGDYRLPLLMIGKSCKPRCFNNVNRSALPVIYANQTKAWMNTAIFTSWFFDQFVPSVRAYLKEKNLSEKAVLLLDNAPTHPSSEVLQTPDGFIKCFFLHANTTSVIQPMDQGVLENLKRRYKRALLEKLLLSMEDGTPEVFVKSLNIKDCVYMCASAWNDIREESLARSFNKLLTDKSSPENQPSSASATEDSSTESLCSSADDEQIVDMGSQLNLSAQEVQEWLDSDKNLTEELTDEEIVQLSKQDSQGDTSDDEEEDIQEQPLLISHTVAAEAFELIISYMEQQPETPSVQLMLLNNLKSAAVDKAFNSKKQSHITDFFTKSC